MVLRNRFRLSHTAVLGPVFYISKFTGLLPICFNFGFISRKRICCKNNNNGKPFSVSIFGLFISLLHLVNQVFTFLKLMQFCVETAVEFKVTCMRGNHCAIYGIFLSHVSVSILNILTAIFNHKDSVRCLNTAYNVLKRQKLHSRLPLASFSIIGFLALHALRFVISMTLYSVTYPLFYYGYYVSYLVPIVTVNFVAILALTAENSYKFINQNLEILYNEPYKPRHFIKKISRLTEMHNDVTDFVDEISSCFGIDIFLAMFDCFFQLVLFLYLTIWTLFVEGLFQNGIMPYMNGTSEIVTTLLKIVYLCYRCHKTSYHGHLTLWYLHRLSSRSDLSPQCYQQINIFVMQHKIRAIGITALKLFSLNMDLLFKILGIVSTYFIVLVQFQISGRRQTFTSNKNTEECTVWPCLSG